MSSIYRGQLTKVGGGIVLIERPLHTSMLDVEFTQLSDCGPTREHNEDYIGHVVPATPAESRNRGWLFALADGVGGQQQGEVASLTAVESVLAGFRETTAGESHAALLPRLVQTANAHVHDAAITAGPSGTGMATTLVACGLRYDRVVVVHVGDSRCYLIRRGHATVLTRDHTVANEQVRLGILSSRQAASGPTSHVLSRSLGTELFVNVESCEHLVLPGDVLLLCSDGLHGAVSSSDMAHMVSRSSDLNAAAHNLVELANEQDGRDNVSLQLIRVKAVERVGMYRGRPYKLR